MRISKVGVVGAGLMGHGIAQVAAQAGHEVVLREADQERLDRGLAMIDEQLARAVEKQKIAPKDAEAARGRIFPTLGYAYFRDCELVIEAITEDLELKRGAWRELDQVVADGALLATNTSSLSVIDVAVVTRRPDRFIGLHFFNPPQVMPLVEVVSTIATSAEAFEAGMGFAEKLGKLAVPARDRAGLIVNRLLVPYLLDAVRALEEGVGTIEAIDAAMKAGTNHPMGPFTLLDFIGLDTTKSIAEVMFDEYRERRFAPPPTLRRLVTAGFHGRKAGRGFYDYSGEQPVPADLGR